MYLKKEKKRNQQVLELFHSEGLPLCWFSERKCKYVLETLKDSFSSIKLRRSRRRDFLPDGSFTVFHQSFFHFGRSVINAILSGGGRLGDANVRSRRRPLRTHTLCPSSVHQQSVSSRRRVHSCSNFRSLATSDLKNLPVRIQTCCDRVCVMAVY